MTLNEIIAAALAELGRGHDSRSIDSVKQRFTHFANDGLRDIAATMKLTKTEELRITGSTVDLLELSRPCLKVLAVVQDGFPLRFSVSEASNIVSVRGVGIVEVSYRYMPKYMTVSTDVPEIPEYMHGLIVSYVVARERMSGDTSTQKGYSAYMEMYEMAKMRLLTATAPGHDIDNKW